MTEFNPLVSIIIPVYNGSDYMREAIDSALSQTYKNIEIIVVNDGSNDNGKTDAIAKSYGNKIRYIQKENGGVSTALNCGIRNMRGEYFSWLSHDDVYICTKIEHSVKALSKLEDKNTLICCRSIHIDKFSNPIKTIKRTKKIEEMCSWENALFKILKYGSINGCALLIPKIVFDKCGLFDETLKFNQDGFMWQKIFLNKFSMYYISTVEVKNRIHDGQLTQRAQYLFHKDCDKMSEYLIPRLIKISTKEKNFIREYLLYNAKYANRNVVNKGKKELRNLDYITCYDLFIIYIGYLYGYIRPIIRKIYYLTIRKIKTT